MSLTKLLLMFGRLWRENRTSKPIRLAFLIIGIQLLLIVLSITLLPPLIPFYYSRPWGESQLAQPTTLLILPLFSIVFLLINSIISALIFEQHSFASQLILWGSMIVAVFNLITIIRLLLILII